MILTHKIENYPGIQSITGYELSNIMKQQAENFGCDIKSNVSLEKISLEDDIKIFKLSNGEEFAANSVILATGGRSRRLGVVGEKEFSGRGISYCATCDGDFFQDKDIIVVGGGNTALEEAVSLTKYASSVTVVHQFDYFQAFEAAISEAQENPKIDFIMNSAITEFAGDKKLNQVKIKNLKTDEISVREIDGAFIFIGYVPNSENLPESIERNQWNEIIVDSNFQTNIKGVFAGGDLIPKRYRQITTAVADGTQAALYAAEYVNNLKKVLV
jgi:thioredoxin reductase (NADPH)